MNERDYWTLMAMDKFGGSFVIALANLARRADSTNLALIKSTWSEYWLDYEETGRRLEEENKQ